MRGKKSSGDTPEKVVQQLVKLRKQLKHDLSTDWRAFLVRNINVKLSNLGASRKWNITDTFPAVRKPEPAPSSGMASLSAQRPENVPNNTPKKHKDVKIESSAVKEMMKRPQTSVDSMVIRAIVHLNEPGGSTVKSIQEFVRAHYDLKCPALTNVFIRSYLKTASAGDTPVLKTTTQKP